MKFSLKGKWLLKNLSSNDLPIEAQVPGCNYTALMDAGVIKDPFFGLNEHDSLWVAECDWLYSKRFIVDDGMLLAPSIELVCDMIDTLSTITLNGTVVGTTDNVNIGYRFDVKKLLVPGENLLEIALRSPVKFARESLKTTKAVPNGMGIVGATNIRKTPCQFGWDWGPILPPSGIQRDIYIEYGLTTKLDDMLISQRHTKEGVYVTVSASVLGENTDYDYRLTLTEPNGNVIEKMGVSANRIEREILIDNPELWWTNDLSDKAIQPLYSVRLAIEHVGEVISECTKRIGLRTIELDRSKDEFGYNFCFKVNGVPIFAKGADWIPADCFVERVTKTELNYLLDSAVFSHMNMLRVWGGGFYESDEFYDLCDEKGILVWQDFVFACSPYPFFIEEFTANVLREVEYNVKRLRHHASLGVWCGNNEIEECSLAWISLKYYIDWTEKFFWHILESEVRKYDTVTPYTPGSPIGIRHNVGCKADNVGDTHLWAVWHGLQDFKYYRKRKTRFCSEYGFESLPDIKTIRAFAGDDSSVYDLQSELFNSHQKCKSGNQKMLFYIASRFRLPKHFEDIIYLSQLCQSECIMDAAEFWRRNKGRCNGALYWQINDCWPVCSWASMDYYGNYKALQYTARRFFAPVAVSLDDNKDRVDIYVVNDTLKARNLTLKYAIVKFDGGVLFKEEMPYVASPVASNMVKSLPLSQFDRKALKDCVMIAEIYDENNALVNRKTVLFGKEKNLKLPKATITKECVVKDGVIEIKLTSDKYARFVYIVNDASSLPMSDNLFDIMPGESVVVTMPAYDGFRPEDVNVNSLTDVEPKGGKLYGLLTQAKVLLKPLNFVNYIARLQGSFEYKE